ncbi:MAG: hypothetical protein HY912_11605, partial [Desulfomonile tiedjei]|nr:hypothetical protein [Desulfomonile tiedjei]
MTQINLRERVWPPYHAFANRKDAGKALCKFWGRGPQANAFVPALPRGGVPVGEPLFGVKGKRIERKIDAVAVTGDTLTSRGGLSVFVRYMESIGVLCVLKQFFGRIRKSSNGQDIGEIFKQLFCYFVDGTSFHLTRFDTLKKNGGCGAGIECDPDSLLPSHSVKLFFRPCSWGLSAFLRRVLMKPFIWRLRIARPAVIVLGIDTMVGENETVSKFTPND